MKYDYNYLMRLSKNISYFIFPLESYLRDRWMRDKIQIDITDTDELLIHIVFSKFSQKLWIHSVNIYEFYLIIILLHWVIIVG